MQIEKTKNDSVTELIKKLKQLDEVSIRLVKNSAETLLLHQELSGKKVG